MQNLLRFFCVLLLALMLCGCGASSPSLPDTSEQKPAQPQPEASVPAEEPVEQPVIEFSIAGFDKEGPGDFGYQTELTMQEQHDLTELLDMDSWEQENNPPEKGFTVHLALTNPDKSKYMWIMDGEDWGTFIRIDKQSGESVIKTAPAEVHQAAKRFAQRLRMRDENIPDMNPAQQELFDTYLFPWALQTPFDQSWDDPQPHIENMVFYLFFRSCYSLENGNNDQLSQYDKKGENLCVVPAKVVEETILAHFDLPLEWIRNHSEYDAAGGVYRFGTGYGGVGLVGAVTGSRQNGDLLEIDCSWFDWRDGEDSALQIYSHTLTIKPEEDGGWKYVGNKVTWRLNEEK